MATIYAVIFREKRRRRRAPRLAARVLVCLAIAAPALVARADDASEARRHAQRATSLAASGKCRQAVIEFDKALAILRDPALLFNRAECHRKLGDAGAAVDDYKQFLSDLPRAPNRVEVEKRIADLQSESAATAAAAAPAMSDIGDEGPARATTARSQGERPVVRAEPSPPSRTREPAAPREVIRTSPSPGAGGESDNGNAEHPGAAIATASDTPSGSSLHAGIAGRPWFWIAVAVVTLGAGVGTFFLLDRDRTNVPSSALGNYKF